MAWRLLLFFSMLLYLNIIFTKSLNSTVSTEKSRYVNSLSSIRFYNVIVFILLSCFWLLGSSSSCPLTNCGCFQGCPWAFVHSFSVIPLFFLLVSAFTFMLDSMPEVSFVGWRPVSRLENKHSAPNFGLKKCGASIPLLISLHPQLLLRIPYT